MRRTLMLALMLACPLGAGPNPSSARTATLYRSATAESLPILFLGLGLIVLGRGLSRSRD